MVVVFDIGIVVLLIEDVSGLVDVLLRFID